MQVPLHFFACRHPRDPPIQLSEFLAKLSCFRSKDSRNVRLLSCPGKEILVVLASHIFVGIPKRRCRWIVSSQAFLWGGPCQLGLPFGILPAFKPTEAPAELYLQGLFVDQRQKTVVF